jgi:hypothetical protein
VELQLPSVVIHKETNGAIPVYGLHFLPALDHAEQEYREKVIWRFLIEEQRRRRRVLNQRA